jgi:hypothetical protein
VDRDGWTSNQDYERAFETFVQLRELALQDLEEMSNFILKSRHGGLREISLDRSRLTIHLN